MNRLEINHVLMYCKMLATFLLRDQNVLEYPWIYLKALTASTVRNSNKYEFSSLALCAAPNRCSQIEFRPFAYSFPLPFQDKMISSRPKT